MKVSVQPTLQQLGELVEADRLADAAQNVFPLYASIPADFITPSVAYLKLSKNSTYSFLFESGSGGELVGRYTYIGFDPVKAIVTGPGYGQEVDPLQVLEKELSQYRAAPFPGLPPLSGGAVGYVGYDCIKYFEPKTKRDLKDVLKIPESMLFMYDTIVAFDHLYQVIKVIVNIHIDQGSPLDTLHHKAVAEIQGIVNTLHEPSIPVPPQPPIVLDQQYASNIGQQGYEAHVRRLKDHIHCGDIIQAVPSQRIARPTSLHPFNVYRQLRIVNPSPYMIYMDCSIFQIVGASPELLVKSDADGRIITHPIAGTVRRGKTVAEDEKCAQDLADSIKDRAEHIMLVDLARNDVNRVCRPETTNVDRLMGVERFSHVMHLVSQVSGILREGKTRFDAFRSIFPAGTVSGAPKVKAMELIGELEGEKRGLYAGAVGHWSYDGMSMDTCIALRTMVFKDGVGYLQAGGGIVFDSDPYDEYVETMNKLASNIACIKNAEAYYAALDV